MTFYMYSTVLILTPVIHYCRSESPSQVFMVVLMWLYNILKDMPKEEWHKIVLSYDNMCHLNILRAARQPLPLPKPFDEMWISITKVSWFTIHLLRLFQIHFALIMQVVDDLHIRNHVDPRCKELYHPATVKEKNPSISFNFMACEQTFVWLSRFKRILCAMPKEHHLFMLHRLIVRRNHYTQLCHTVRRSLYLPKAQRELKE